MSIPWGESGEEAYKIMLSRHGVEFENVGQLNVPERNANYLVFKGGMFGAFRVSKSVLEFVDDRLYAGSVYLIPEEGTTFLEHWYIVKAKLSSKYGAPPIDRKEFIDPYYEGDGLESTAFLTGKARVFCEWDFGNIGSRTNTIMMFIDDPGNPMLNTIVNYLNNDLFAKVMLGVKNVVPNDY